MNVCVQIVVTRTGGTNDSTVWNNSDLLQKMENFLCLSVGFTLNLSARTLTIELFSGRNPCFV